MNRWHIFIGGMSFRYDLGFYYAETLEDAKLAAWRKHRCSFRDCEMSMLSGHKEN